MIPRAELRAHNYEDDARRQIVESGGSLSARVYAGVTVWIVTLDGGFVAQWVPADGEVSTEEDEMWDCRSPVVATIKLVELLQRAKRRFCVKRIDSKADTP